MSKSGRSLSRLSVMWCTLFLLLHQVECRTCLCVIVVLSYASEILALVSDFTKVAL
jgi:hypothetical protein